MGQSKCGISWMHSILSGGGRCVRPQSCWASQPGERDVHKHILISKSVANDLVVAYTPQGEAVVVKMAGLSPQLRGIWYNPRDGDVEAAEVREGNGKRVYEAPGDGDWLLVLA